MARGIDKLSPDARKRLERQAGPAFVEPMLAVLTKERFDDPDWIFERKFDGERCLAVCTRGSVRLYSRNRKQIDSHYPEVAEALASEHADLALDGEIVAFEQGVTSFSRLQGRMKLEDPEQARESAIAVYYYAFDILHYDGWNTIGVSQRERKKLLKGALQWRDPLRYTPHRNEYGTDLYKSACEKGWEGLVAKRAEAPYSRSRSRNWLKFKCVSRQEFVIGGFTPPEGSRINFGSLLIGYYKQGELRYAGKVGTGFDHQTLLELGKLLKGLRSKGPPFAGKNLPNDAFWVKPDLVCEVGFSEWTRAGRLRHPSYLGLREDKDPKQVHREYRG